MLLIKTEQTLSSVLMPLFNRMDVYKNSVLWEKTYGGSLDDEAKGIVLSSDGGYILAGYTKSFGAGASDMYLVRTDSNGTMLWNMTYGGAKDDGANSIVRAADGGYVLAGYTNSNVQSQSTWIVKVNASGQMQWNTICDGQAATSIATTSDGGYVLTVEHPNAYGLVKINSIGQVQWNRTYPIPSYSGRAQSVVQDVGGGYAIAGWLKSETGENATWLIKTDSIGTLLWNRTYTGLGTYSMVQTNSGGYALTGDCPILLITDSAGNVIRNQTYGALSDPSIAFTRGYSVIQPATDEYVIAMVELLWTNPSGLQTYIVSVNFRTNL